ncbi:transposase [Microbacterium lacticum]|nr:transposase [Microbacterium lacticum]
MGASTDSSITRTTGRTTPRCSTPRRSVEQVELATLEWVWWWNNSRLHGELDMRTPAEVEQAYYADQESANPAPVGQGSR